METSSSHQKPSSALSFVVADRRSEPRMSAEVLGLDSEARLSLGLHGRLINVSNGGALLELQEWIRPGTRTELRLFKPVANKEPEKITAFGQVARCWVHRLSPLRYRAAMVFEAASPVASVPGAGECAAVVARAS